MFIEYLKCKPLVWGLKYISVFHANEEADVIILTNAFYRGGSVRVRGHKYFGWVTEYWD